MPAIRDVLPTEGTKVREIFTQAQNLLQRKQPTTETDEIEQSAVQSGATQKSIRNRLKILFHKPQK